MQSFSENVLIASIKKKNGYDKLRGEWSWFIPNLPPYQ